LNSAHAQSSIEIRWGRGVDVNLELVRIELPPRPIVYSHTRSLYNDYTAYSISNLRSYAE